jgi:hypothetical protein
MSKPDQIALVQFIHPGGEQGMTRPGWCSWNISSKPHRRKFMYGVGAYDDGQQTAHGSIGFWGEWEAPSAVMRTKTTNGHLPRYLHTPVYQEPESHEGLRDTDPFVFGDRMLYTGCRQHTHYDRAEGPIETALRRLDRGSVIVFGSAIQKRFVVDTVFVVGDHSDYPNREYESLDGLVSPEYHSITLKPSALAVPSVESFRLYRGATIDDPVEGMYSFVPCRPINHDEPLFARPGIALPEMVTQNLTQGKKITAVNEARDLYKAWSSIREQVIGSGCAVAHNIELSPRMRRA